jgi:hypothetical protein
MADAMPEDPFVFQLPSRARESRAQDVRLSWREACSEVRLAYLAWRKAGPGRAGQAFAAYVAAADREAEAAEALRPEPAPAASRRCESSRPS